MKIVVLNTWVVVAVATATDVIVTGRVDVLVESLVTVSESVDTLVDVLTEVSVKVLVSS